jgi:hypothetical protein
VSVCSRCSARAVTWLCRACESDLRELLLGLSGALDHLIDEVNGQTRKGESSRRGSDNTAPMLCNLSASWHLDVIHSMLTGWVTHLLGDRAARMAPRDFIGPLPDGWFRGHATADTKQAAIWLANHTSRICADEAAGECFQDVKQAVDTIELVVNRPELSDRVLGRCPTTVTDNYGQRTCRTDLTAGRAEKSVQCPTCKTTYDIAELHAQQLETTEGMSFTLSELFKQVLPIRCEYVPLRTLQHWIAHNRLVPTGYDAEG